MGNWIQDPKSLDLGALVFLGDALSVYHVTRIMVQWLCQAEAPPGIPKEAPQ